MTDVDVDIILIHISFRFVSEFHLVLCLAKNILGTPFGEHCYALGSVAEAMGGIAGRVDAMFGAVECQKTTGSLHYHFFIFVQRLHQYATLKEIAEKLKNELVKTSEWKKLESAICCESYSDPQQFNKERQTLKGN